MLQRLLFVLIVLTVSSANVDAATLRIDSNTAMDFNLPGEHWLLFREAPAFLVDETMEHLGHELAGQGKSPGEEALRQAALKRLAANEAFLCNPASRACLVVDFSPLREGEEAPSRRAVAASARYAGEGLADEEGIADLQQKSEKYRLEGAETAYRIDASFRQHGEPRRFIGIVGFRQPCWFYLYYTDPLNEPKDYSEMEVVLDSLVLRATGSER